MLFRRNRCRKFFIQIGPSHDIHFNFDVFIICFIKFINDFLQYFTIRCSKPIPKVKVTSLSESDSAELPPPQAPKIPVAATNKEPINHFYLSFFVPPSSDKRHLTTFQDSGFNKQLIFPSSAFTFVE